MNYKEALNVRVGDLLCLKYSNYKQTTVLGIEHNRRYHTIGFRCTDGEYTHKEVILPISNEELAGKYIKNPRTKVYISRTDRTGGLYSVLVEDTDAFCLASFETRAEAEQYISVHSLKKVGEKRPP